MPHIIEHPDCYEYTGSSGIPIRFAKVDPPGDSGIGSKPSEILASIKAADPEANTVVQYQPKEVHVPALRMAMAKLGFMAKAREGLATLSDYEREVFDHGVTISSTGAVAQAIRRISGATDDAWRGILVMAEKIVEFGLAD